MSLAEIPVVVTFVLKFNETITMKIQLFLSSTLNFSTNLNRDVRVIQSETTKRSHKIGQVFRAYTPFILYLYSIKVTKALRKEKICNFCKPEKGDIYYIYYIFTLEFEIFHSVCFCALLMLIQKF